MSKQRRTRQLARARRRTTPAAAARAEPKRQPEPQQGRQQRARKRVEWPDWVLAVAHPKKRAFLVRYAECGNVAAAAQAVGIGRRTHYDWLAIDEAYREAFKHAEEEAADRLEQEARRRAVEGWDEPVYQKAQLVGTVRKYSDTLLIFLLKGARPEKYRERVDVGSEPGRPLAVQVSDVDAEAAARLVTEFARQQTDKARADGAGEGH